MKDKRLPGLSQATIKRLEEHYRQHPTRRRLEEVVEAAEKAKPPKGRAVALSTTCQEFYMDSGDSLNYA